MPSGPLSSAAVAAPPSPLKPAFSLFPATVEIMPLVACWCIPWPLTDTVVSCEAVVVSDTKARTTAYRSVKRGRKFMSVSSNVRNCWWEDNLVRCALD